MNENGVYYPVKMGIFYVLIQNLDLCWIILLNVITVYLHRTKLNVLNAILSILIPNNTSMGLILSHFCGNTFLCIHVFIKCYMEYMDFYSGFWKMETSWPCACSVDVYLYYYFLCSLLSISCTSLYWSILNRQLEQATISLNIFYLWYLAPELVFIPRIPGCAVVSVNLYLGSLSPHSFL